MAKRGRPPLPEERKRKKWAVVPLTAEEFERFRGIADRRGVGLSTWLRGLVLEELARDRPSRLSRAEAVPPEFMTKPLQVLLRPEEHEAVKAAAATAKFAAYSHWIRALAYAAAKQEAA